MEMRVQVNTPKKDLFRFQRIFKDWSFQVHTYVRACVHTSRFRFLCIYLKEGRFKNLVIDKLSSLSSRKIREIKKKTAYTMFSIICFLGHGRKFHGWIFSNNASELWIFKIIYLVRFWNQKIQICAKNILHERRQVYNRSLQIYYKLTSHLCAIYILVAGASENNENDASKVHKIQIYERTTQRNIEHGANIKCRDI